jgi:hypothetical protein
MGDINDEVLENRRKIQYASTAFDQIDILSGSSIFGGSGTNNEDADGTQNAKKINLGTETIKGTTNLSINGQLKHPQSLGTLNMRNTIIDTITGSNTTSVSKIVVGDGKSLNNRRETSSLISQISPASESHTITLDNDVIRIKSEIEVDETIDISEVGLKDSNGNLLQYFTL